MGMDLDAFAGFVGRLDDTHRTIIHDLFFTEAMHIKPFAIEFHQIGLFVVDCHWIAFPDRILPHPRYAGFFSPSK